MVRWARAGVLGVVLACAAFGLRHALGAERTQPDSEVGAALLIEAVVLGVPFAVLIAVGGLLRRRAANERNAARVATLTAVLEGVAAVLVAGYVQLMAGLFQEPANAAFVAATWGGALVLLVLAWLAEDALARR